MAELRVARGFLARLRGLALRSGMPRGAAGLVIPRCRSVHTLGMRFEIDVVFLGGDGRVLRVAEGVPPLRLVSCRGAAAVIETPAGEAGMITRMAENQRRRLLAGLNPRVPIYRDSYNEYFVLVLSATMAAVVAPVVFYVAMAVSELWPAIVFVALCAGLTLLVIFGLGRPQMKRHERVGWALLWGGTSAVLALCFFYLVAEPTL